MDANKLIDLLVDDPRATVTDLADILNDTEENVDHEIKRFGFMGNMQLRL